MYAAFPAFLYFNASLGAAMLEPLLIAQDNLTDLSYAAQDLGELSLCHDALDEPHARLGSQYPIASGVHGGHPQGVERESSMAYWGRRIAEHTMLVSESGNMLIMLLAQARASGDGSLLVQHVRSALIIC